MYENAYLSIKNPKASRALKRALDPGRRMLASLTRLHFATSATFGLRSWGPPLDQILDPHLKTNRISSFWAAYQIAEDRNSVEKFLSRQLQGKLLYFLHVNGSGIDSSLQVEVKFFLLFLIINLVFHKFHSKGILDGDEREKLRDVPQFTIY